ncbi:MAG: DNA-3-methyladenine glycosylase [Bacteroidota bacterium]
MTDNNNQRLGADFYTNTDVCEVAKSLLGKTLISQMDGVRTSGIIVETEAYSYKEKACHAYMNRNTKRTYVLFRKGGIAYVYLCYGIHKLLNIVTNVEGAAEAVLIRAIEPQEGIEFMIGRRGLSKKSYALTSGPGKLSQALGITMKHNNTNLFGDQLWIEEGKESLAEIEMSPRIGVAYAEEDALLPWRFSYAKNPWVSKGNNRYHNVLSS